MKTIQRASYLALVLSTLMSTTGCFDSGSGDDGDNGGPIVTPEPQPEPQPEPEPEREKIPDAADPTADASAINYNDMAVHDPSVIRDDDGTFYVFGSHLDAAKSTDLMRWERIAGGGVNDANPLFNTYASEISEGLEWVGGHQGSWAADVIKLNDGKYYFYYNHCANPASETGDCNTPRSYLGVAVADTIEGPYIDQGIFIYSGMTPEEIAAGYVPDGFTGTEYNPTIHPNAIDPDVFYDKDGKLWMLYGSYSGGIFILEMDETTGKPKPGQGYGKHLTGGDHSAIEGTYMLYSPESDYYYLFMSFGGFFSTDGYNIRIARSKTPDGPFLDAEGNDMAEARGSNWDSFAPYGVKMMGGFEFASDAGDPYPSRGYLAPGHNSAYYDEETGKHFLITHTRFPNRGEAHSVRVHEMFVNADGWLVASPQRYTPIEGDNIVDSNDLNGTYKFINHGKDINRTAKPTLYVTLNDDGSVSGEVTGEYVHDVENPSRISFTLEIDGETEEYEGITRWQWNAQAEKLVPVFTAVSGTGESIWGLRMDDQSDSNTLTAITANLSVPANTADDSIDLPTRGTRGATIAWVSSDDSVIKPSGRVTRPNAGEGDATVTLTANVSLNGMDTTVNFTITVEERQPYNRTAWYPFEDNLQESAGRFAAGTATGDRIFNSGNVGFTAGHDGQALQLDGSNGVLLPEGLIDNYEYTVSFWAKPTAITQHTPTFFGTVKEEATDSNAPYSNHWLSFVPHAWDGNTMLWGKNGDPIYFDGATGELIPAATWTHMAFAVDNGHVRVYLNGEEKFSGGTLIDFFSGNTGNFALGVNYWDLPFNGQIDEFKVYESALTAEEVRNLDIDNQSDEELLASAAAILDLGDLSAVTADFELPTTGPYAAAVRWTSSNPNAISVDGDTGVVTRPEGADSEVTLTATLSLNGAQQVKTFNATVKSTGLPAPVAHFGFEQTLDDAAGNFGSGAVVGALINEAGGSITYAEGVVGQAAVFDGASGVVLPDDLIADHSYSFTLWLSPSALSPYTTSFFGWAANNSWISLLPNGFGEDTMLWSGESWFDANTGIQIPQDSWSQLAVTVNSGEVSVYVNGEQAFTGSNFPDVFGPAAERNFALGVNFWDTPYAGMMDEVKVYDYAVSAEDVLALYEAELLGEQ
ncbi:LamG-like jellyroll fold domain-containing protein [Microbulbifer sp. YPW1]|uniref:LamG-like jellyroll fold domain-containing protein n=1 Tax=Microbulbifer sp. YPW1 TaxID=2745199 RepID=UPI001597EB7A|nr:LamG-like jellyroll fold domain-containing protein [Microbulbifer sp. YPW1]QKX16101.1 family 43 glycosylhydrolase [Microbulbifer sp. YPW1]